ncbi:hypothetical protein [Bizionia paragorgiae]|nr:hypothetical protein [Bizionia paragorgiae]
MLPILAVLNTPNKTPWPGYPEEGSEIFTYTQYEYPDNKSHLVK